MTDQPHERIEAYVQRICRRAEILRGFADREAAKGPGRSQMADKDADDEEQLAADLRGLVAENAELREEADSLRERTLERTIRAQDSEARYAALLEREGRMREALRQIAEIGTRVAGGENYTNAQANIALAALAEQQEGL